MKLKFLLSLILALSMLACACSSSENTENSEKDVKAPEETVESVDEAIPESPVCLESENYSVDLNTLKFFYFTDVYNIYQNYGQYLQYMSPDQTAPDFTKSLSEQFYDSSNGQTWHDYLFASTMQRMQLILSYAEEAKAAGFEFDTSSLAEAYINTLTSYAEDENLSFEEYLEKYYGDGINKAVVKSALELQYLASQYQEKLIAEYEASVTEEDILAYKDTLGEEVDDSATRDVRHILLMPDTYGSDDAAKAKAEEVLALYLEGEKTEASFEALGEEYNEDGNNLYENVTKGQMVTEFEEWLFDESRNEGDTGIVKTDYGYHIMYYVGEGLPKWRSEAIDSIVDTKNQEYAAVLLEKVDETVKQNEDNIVLVPALLPEAAFATE